MRARGWVARIQKSEAKKIKELHKEAEKAQQQQRPGELLSTMFCVRSFEVLVHCLLCLNDLLFLVFKFSDKHTDSLAGVFDG